MPFSFLEEKHANNPRVEYFLNEYKEKKELYKSFCLAVVNILKKILERDHNKYQITYRIKTEESLREKIIRKMAHGKVYKKLRNIEDLAGIRIIFYNEADKANFIKHFYKEFSASRIKIEHHANKKGYRAIHAVLSLEPKRLQLAEYKDFKNLRCEVQITSILYHAWAEFEHDIFYKQNSSLEKNKETFSVCKKKMENALQNYIENAVKEFEEIARATDGVKTPRKAALRLKN